MFAEAFTPGYNGGKFKYDSQKLSVFEGHSQKLVFTSSLSKLQNWVQLSTFLSQPKEPD